MNSIEVRLQLRPKGDDVYTLELTCDGLISGIPVGVRNARCELTFAKACLLELSNDSAAYGRELAEQLFADESLREIFTAAYEQAGQGGVFRLWLDLPDDDDGLQQVIWERIQHPRSLYPICTDQRVLIARCGAMSTRDEHDLPPRPSLGVLGLIANPVDLGAYGCAIIDSAAEQERFCEALTSADATIRPTLLVSGGAARPTWKVLKEQLLARAYDILYIACHGVVRNDENQSYLILEDEQGQSAFVPSAEIAHFIGHGLPPSHRPALVFLASCYSAGDGYAKASLFLGPQLVRVGVPAVVGFQHAVSLQTVSEAISVFFTQLFDHGQVGLALTATRAVLRSYDGDWHALDEWWKPTLFLSQRNDRLWRKLPGFEGLHRALSEYFKHFLHRLRIQPREPELNLLAQSIACCGGFQAQPVEALRALRSSADGLSQLIKMLYDHDAGSPQFAQLEQVLSEMPGLERTVPWSDTFALLTLLQQIAQQGVNLDEEMRRFYYHRIQDKKLNSDERGIAMQWRAIDELGRRGGNPPPLVALVQHLAGLPELSRMQPDLRAWLRTTAESLGHPPDTYERVAAPEHGAAVGCQRLLLVLKSTGTPQDEAWEADVHFTPDDREWWPKFALLQGNSRQELAAKIEHMINHNAELTNRFDLQRDIYLEIALPDHWLFWPIDMLQLTLRDEPEPLGSLYPCVVRSASRLLAYRPQTWRDWRRRWGQWSQAGDLTPEDYLPVHQPRDCQLEHLQRQLVKNRQIGCIIGSVLLAEEQHEPLARKLMAYGVPVMLWYRGPHQTELPAAESLKDELGSDRDLPTRTFELRCLAHAEHPAPALGNHLTLLWDNPDSLPKTYKPALSALE